MAALEHGATVLAMDLAHLHGQAESQALAGTDHAEANWEGLRAAVRGGLCARSARRIGVGSRCAGPAAFGVYRLLSKIPDGEQVEDFVRQWLGPLLDYDAAKGSALVATLSGYFECGGNYDLTTKTLSLHPAPCAPSAAASRDFRARPHRPDVRFNLQLATRA